LKHCLKKLKKAKLSGIASDNKKRMDASSSEKAKNPQFQDAQL
jgi:hypothetical protein